MCGLFGNGSQRAIVLVKDGKGLGLEDFAAGPTCTRPVAAVGCLVIHSRHRGSALYQRRFDLGPGYCRYSEGGYDAYFFFTKLNYRFYSYSLQVR